MWQKEIAHGSIREGDGDGAWETNRRYIALLRYPLGFGKRFGMRNETKLLSMVR